MNTFWMAPCCALGMLVCAGAAHAAFWQVIRDTPVREAPSDGARVLDTARKGWIVNTMTREDAAPQWITVVELQQRAGDGMAYAHLLYRTPGEPVYIRAEDVTPVADQTGTPLKEEDAATAGVRVRRLPLPQTTDPRFSEVMNDAALATALETWVEQCNAVLGGYEGMAPDAVAREVIAWTDDGTFAGTGAVENRAMPLLERWMRSRYAASPAAISDADRKMLEALAACGLTPEIAEGSPFLMADLSLLRARISFTPPVAAYSAYAALLDRQPRILFSDGGCRYSVNEMGTWAAQWERYLNTVPAGSCYFTEGKKRYLEFATHILFSDLPNTPAFPASTHGAMHAAWMAALERVASENPGTETAALITEFLARIQRNGNTLAPSDKKALLIRLKAIPSSGAAAPAATPGTPGSPS